MKKLNLVALCSLIILSATSGVLVSCGSGENNVNDLKESKLTFEANTVIENVSYMYSLFVRDGNTFDMSCDKNEKFALNGTWSLEKGWGYTFNFDDSQKTSVVATYSKTTRKHFFTYSIAVTDKNTESLKFEAGDKDFYSSLDEHYCIPEKRNAKYVFKQLAGASGMEFYLKETAVSVINGDTISKTGTYVFDSNKKVFTFQIEGQSYLSEYFETVDAYKAVLPGGAGGPMGGSTSTAYYCSDAAKFLTLKESDFVVPVLYTFSASSWSLELNARFSASLKQQGWGGLNEIAKGSYTFEEDVFTLTLSGVTNPITSTKVDGIYHLGFSITTKDWQNNETVNNLDLTYQPA